MENKVNDNKIIIRKKGTVISKAGEKTVVVAVDTFKTHTKYKKKYKSTKKYKVHDEENRCQVGEKLEIFSCLPISKGKKYKVADKA